MTRISHKRQTKLTINSQKVAPYIFVLPFVIIFAVFFAVPIFKMCLMSFQNIVIGSSDWVGLNNYKRLLLSSEFPIAIRNTLTYTVLTLLILIPFPLLFAVMLNSKAMRGANFFRSTLFIPILCCVVVAGIAFRFIFNETTNSLANQIAMNLFGTKKIMWKSLRWPAMFVLTTLATWRWMGINIVYFLSGLQSIPEDIIEAGSIDGANTWQQFRYITLPSLKPTIIYVLTISIYGGLAMFTESHMIWGGKSSPMNVGLTIVGFVYQKGIGQGDYSFASAIGVVLLAVTLIINFTQLRLTGTIGGGRKKND